VNQVMSVSGKYVMTTIYIMRVINMLDKEKWEYSREEAKDLAQDYLDREETRASCIKYFISHFKISNATANRWYNKIYDELVIPDISNALDIKSYKDTVESEIEKCLKKLKDLSIEEKVNVLTKITKLKKDLRKL
jgi:hypothetical protein